MAQFIFGSFAEGEVDKVIAASQSGTIDERTMENVIDFLSKSFTEAVKTAIPAVTTAEQPCVVVNKKSVQRKQVAQPIRRRNNGANGLKNLNSMTKSQLRKCTPGHLFDITRRLYERALITKGQLSGR